MVIFNSIPTDAAQVMAFSSIMLTTDAHNPRVIEKMTKKQFVTLTRGMNGEGNFPKDFLEYMFEKVVDEPLIRIDHTTTLMPYATKRGWVYVPRRKSSWKRYYALLYEDTIYLQRKPLVRMSFVALVSSDSHSKRIASGVKELHLLKWFLLKYNVSFSFPYDCNYYCQNQ